MAAIRIRAFLILLLCLMVQMGLVAPVAAMPDAAPVMTPMVMAPTCATPCMADMATPHAPAPRANGNHMQPCCHAPAAPGWIAPARARLMPPGDRGAVQWRIAAHTARPTQGRLPPLRPPRHGIA